MTLGVGTDIAASQVRSMYERMERVGLSPRDTVCHLLLLAFSRATALGLTESELFELVMETTEVAFGPVPDEMIDKLAAEVAAAGAVPS